MCRSTTPAWKLIASWLTFIVSFDMLIILFVFVPYQCGRVAVDSGGEYVCNLWTGWYIFGTLFTIISVCTGYHVYQNWNTMMDFVAKIVRNKNISLGIRIRPGIEKK